MKLGETSNDLKLMGFRDAHHAGGVLVTCATEIAPGAAVYFTNDDCNIVAPCTFLTQVPDAIVDPFLPPRVLLAGTLFWVMLMPDRTEGLHHVFTIKRTHAPDTGVACGKCSRAAGHQGPCAASPVDGADDDDDDGCGGCY